MGPTLSLENNLSVSSSRHLPVDLIGLQYEASCLFCSCFVTVAADTEEKGPFYRQKVPGMGLSTSNHYFYLFVTLAPRSLLIPGSGHATACQNNQPHVLI